MQIIEMGGQGEKLRCVVAAENAPELAVKAVALVKAIADIEIKMAGKNVEVLETS